MPREGEPHEGEEQVISFWNSKRRAHIFLFLKSDNAKVAKERKRLAAQAIPEDDPDMPELQAEMSSASVSPPVEDFGWMFEVQKGGIDDVKNMVWGMFGSADSDAAPRTLVLGPFKPEGDLTAVGHVNTNPLHPSACCVDLRP